MASSENSGIAGGGPARFDRAAHAGGFGRAALGLPFAIVCLGGVGCVVPLSSSSPATDASPESAAPESGVAQGDATDGGGADGAGGHPEGGDATSGVDVGTPDDAPSLVSDGPQAGGWVNVTGNLAGISSTCANLAGVAAKEDEDLLIASVASVGLYGSRNGGQTWQPIGANGGASPVSNRMTGILFDPQTTTRWWEVGIYGPSPFLTTDDGNTLVEKGTISHTDYLGVDFSDPTRSTLVAGGHEVGQTVYLSTNGGSTWTNIGGGLPSGAYCTIPLVLSANTFLVGCQTAGIYRTTDTGATWHQQSASGGDAPPLVAQDGTIYWVGADTKMAKSSDQGVTWTTVGPSGVIAGPGGGVTNWKPVELPGGRLAVVGAKAIMISADQGATWSAATADLPITSGEDIHGVVYSVPRKAFYVWHNSCASGGAIPVPADAIMRFDFDYTKP